MEFIKKVSRKIIFPALVSTGIEKLFLKNSNNSCLILNYHGIVDEYNKLLSKNHLPVEQFRKHLTYFKENFNVISLSKAFDIYHSNSKTDKRNIVITFDDGYENNLTNALPVLKEFSFPATVFVTAQSILYPSRGLWYDEIDLLASKIEFKNLKNIMLASYSDIVSLNSYPELKEHIKNLNMDGKKYLQDKIISIKEFKNAIYSCNTEYWKMLDGDNLKILAAEDNIEIGSHSVSHSNLDRIDEMMLLRELKESKELIENVINKKVKSIAFPDGAYNEEVKKLCLNLGYDKLLAVNYKLESDLKDENILPRLSISNTTTFESVMITVNRAFATFGF